MFNQGNKLLPTVMVWYFLFRITEGWALGGILRARDSLKAPQREFGPHGLERRFRWYVGGVDSNYGNLYAKTYLNE